MDSLDTGPAPKTIGRFHITPLPSMHVVSMRYFSASGAFATAFHDLLGVQLDSRTNGLQVPPGKDAMVIWRSPTESLLLTADSTGIVHLENQLGRHSDGYMVTLTGGECVVQIEGVAIDELIGSLSSHDSMPGIHESRLAPIANVRTILIRPKQDRLYVVVDRAYLQHLMLAISEAASFPSLPFAELQSGYPIHIP